MVQTYSISLLLVIALACTTLTSARYLQLQGTDERDKRQIGDLKTAEYLALMTLNQMHRLPSHCHHVACGLVDVIASGKRRKRSIGSMFDTLNTDQKMRVLNSLLTLAADDNGDSNMS